MAEQRQNVYNKVWEVNDVVPLLLDFNDRLNFAIQLDVLKFPSHDTPLGALTCTDMLLRYGAGGASLGATVSIL